MHKHSKGYPNDTAEVLSLIGPIGPGLRAFPQQLRLPRSHESHESLRSLSAMFSMFSSPFPNASRRSVLSMSDMSSKNCDRMESIWDLGPMICWMIKTRRRPCRRRSLKGLLKSAPFALWASMSLVPSACCPTTFLWIEYCSLTSQDAFNASLQLSKFKEICFGIWRAHGHVLLLVTISSSLYWNLLGHLQEMATGM